MATRTPNRGRSKPGIYHRIQPALSHGLAAYNLLYTAAWGYVILLAVNHPRTPDAEGSTVAKRLLWGTSVPVFVPHTLAPLTTAYAAVGDTTNSPLPPTPPCAATASASGARKVPRSGATR
ncbi:hypothetical protein FA95DRAFT_1423270 [Auriscalpium vulgare]|uniref:Uncharacterized protein n=1 Tax=Auriscalpium vulgare TaxID=40419 RepID=A0ACB8RPR6_9AGAM|nr:hypothetical protein FA95DRAFT_1423270 [Auriscalpium vulgare]